MLWNDASKTVNDFIGMTFSVFNPFWRVLCYEEDTGWLEMFITHSDTDSSFSVRFSFSSLIFSFPSLLDSN